MNCCCAASTLFTLGQSVPMDNLLALQSVFKKITFISYFTIKPAADEVDMYLEQFSRLLLNNRKDSLLITGRIVHNKLEMPPNVKMFNDLNEMVNKI